MHVQINKTSMPDILEQSKESPAATIDISDVEDEDFEGRKWGLVLNI